MNTYLLLKTVHILSSVLMVGTGFGSAFYMFFANRSGNVQAQAVVSRLVVRADWWFTTPAVIIQPVSGVAMMVVAGWPWHTPWLLLSMGLYALAGVCWLPVVAMQIRMTKLAAIAASSNQELPGEYRLLARRWEALGYPAFVAMLAVYYLMVNKPALWG